MLKFNVNIRIFFLVMSKNFINNNVDLILGTLDKIFIKDIVMIIIDYLIKDFYNISSLNINVVYHKCPSIIITNDFIYYNYLCTNFLCDIKGKSYFLNNLYSKYLNLSPKRNLLIEKILFHNNEIFFIDACYIFVTNCEFVVIRHWEHSYDRYIIDVAINDKYIYLFKHSIYDIIIIYDLMGKNEKIFDEFCTTSICCNNDYLFVFSTGLISKYDVNTYKIEKVILNESENFYNCKMLTNDKIIATSDGYKYMTIFNLDGTKYCENIRSIYGCYFLNNYAYVIIDNKLKKYVVSRKLFFEKYYNFKLK